MKTITSTAIVALMTATIGLSAIAPAFAQDAAPTTQAQKGPGLNFRHHDQGPRQGGGMGGGDFLNVERGTEAIEIALVRLSHRIELTAEQQPLFDALKTAALVAATDFQTATEGLRPAAPAEGETATAPTFTERLDNGIALQAARLAALQAVQPAATAFFESLTAEQTAALTPQRPDRDGMQGGFGKGGQRHQGQQPGGPDAGPMGGPAPADAPAAPPANG